jgi:hypothetical protein
MRWPRPCDEGITTCRGTCGLPPREDRELRGLQGRRRPRDRVKSAEGPNLAAIHRSPTAQIVGVRQSQPSAASARPQGPLVDAGTARGPTEMRHAPTIRASMVAIPGMVGQDRAGESPRGHPFAWRFRQFHVTPKWSGVRWSVRPGGAAGDRDARGTSGAHKPLGRLLTERGLGGGIVSDRPQPMQGGGCQRHAVRGRLSRLRLAVPEAFDGQLVGKAIVDPHQGLGAPACGR